ncbi:MAG TPA: hypothetical protein VFV55_11370 [Usitatibacteraceae bacterium]|nr:hypothetical protein [Usitatibacteraceae bacterium]
MRHQSILEYAHFRWFKAAIWLSALAGGVYLWHDPVLKPYGGTWLGYALGTLGALLILWLLWFGVRKRRYASRMGTAQGWLSAHVYLGTALLVVATLHTGFELGWNVHTLAYVLMVATVASGFYGVYVYFTVPRLMTANLGEETLDAMLLKVADLDREIREKALSLPDPILRVVHASLDNTRLGGSLARIVTGRDRACPTAAAVRELPEIGKRLSGEAAKLNHEVYTLLLQKNELLARARREVRFKARLDLWLYFHVPLAIALLGALSAHVISVFLYW